MVRNSSSFLMIVILVLGVLFIEKVCPYAIPKHEKYAKDNIIISPFLLEEGLKQLYFGAKDKTAEELKSTLQHLIAFSNKDIDEYLKEKNTQIPSTDGVTLKFGNELFIGNAINILPEYTEKLSSLGYNDTVTEVDFLQTETAVSIMNKWVADQTDNRITEIIKKTDAGTELIFLSALYFMGKWKYSFEKSATKKALFYIEENRSVEVDMMSITGNYRHSILEELDAEAIELPYANSKISMLIILPTNINGIEALVEKLANFVISKFDESSSEQKMILQLPKFKFEFELDLIPILQTLGINTLFTTADLRGMTNSALPLYVSKVIQKGFIEVDEEGTTAAASQATVISSRIGADKFVVNHPFVFYIKDDERIYFTGRVFNIE